MIIKCTGKIDRIRLSKLKAGDTFFSNGIVYLITSEGDSEFEDSFYANITTGEYHEISEDVVVTKCFFLLEEVSEEEYNTYVKKGS